LLLRPLQKEFGECVVASCLSSCLTTVGTVKLAAVLVERCVANNFVTEVEEARGSTARTACNSKTNWWKRNWKWFVPLGCFTVALLFLAFVGSMLVIVFSAMKSTDVYKEALARAKADPAVIEALCMPIKDGFLISGNTNVNGASGESNLAIPISGPKGKGTIYVSANKSLGQWDYSGLIVEVDQTHERIDLLQKSTPSNSP
jgi:Cytochrome oxidase complex assembly protein 1